MKRILLLLVIVAGPVLSHPDTVPHVHEIDQVSMGMGIGLILAGVFFGWLAKGNAR